MAFKNADHPELRDGEVFLTNEDEDGWRCIGWKSKRKGKVAYDTFGRSIPSIKPFFPVFVEEKELRDAGIPFSDISEGA